MCLETILFFFFYKKQKGQRHKHENSDLKANLYFKRPNTNAFYIENKSVNVHHILFQLKTNLCKTKISKNLEK